MFSLGLGNFKLLVSRVSLFKTKRVLVLFYQGGNMVLHLCTDAFFPCGFLSVLTASLASSRDLVLLLTHSYSIIIFTFFIFLLLCSSTNI
jgi:hypothetical protein